MKAPASLWQPQRRELLAELFHAMNQPLTALACSLELALVAPQTAEQYEEIVREAAERVERVSRLTRCLHQLVQADDRGEQSREVDVKKVLREVADELTPVAESLHVNLLLAGDGERRLWCDATRLREALFQMLDLVLASARHELRVELGASGQEAVTLEVTSLLKDVSAETGFESQELARQVAIAAAYGMLESAGATLDALQEGDHLTIRIHLPQTKAHVDTDERHPATFSHF